MRRNIFYRKIPAALAAFVLALALCCQTAAAGRALVPGGYTVGIKLYAEGLMVTEVESGTPAQQAGIRKGDVIIAADGKKTDSAQALLGSIQKSEPIVVRVEDAEGSYYFTFRYAFDKEMAKRGYITVDKGSVTVNGVSLTVCNPTDDTFQVAIIPYTFEHTNFHDIKAGSVVNLEFDIIGKYISRMIQFN